MAVSGVLSFHGCSEVNIIVFALFCRRDETSDEIKKEFTLAWALRGLGLYDGRMV